MTISIRNILREGTRPQHLKIESQLDFLNAKLDKNQYAEMIARYAGFYSPLEKMISKFDKLPESLNWQNRKKLPLLLADLETLSQSPQFNVADESMLPQLSSKAELYGILYVIEGSTLGGQLLSKHFENSISISKESGGKFFHGYGQETGQMWQSFIKVLESEITDESQAEAALAAARATFEKLGNWMSINRA